MTETAIVLVIYSAVISLILGWFKSYVDRKIKDIETNKERIAALESSVKYKEERLTELSEKLSILIETVTQTNLKMVQLQTLMEMHLKIIVKS